MTNQKFELVIVDDKMRKSDAYKKLTTTDKFPLLETSEGCLHESSAICKYLCNLAKKFLGSNAVERSQVDQWVAWTNTTLFPSCYTVYKGIFGWAEVDKADYDQASKDLKAHAKTLNTALEGKKFLVGNSVSLADVVVGSALMFAMQTTLDGGFRKAMKNLEPWAVSVYALNEFKAVHGAVQLCAKPLKPVVKEAPKEPKKKAEAPKPKEEKKVEEKKLDNVQSLPPTPFNLFDFKTFFVNHPDKSGEAVDAFYKELDWEGWSFWKLRYDVLEGEGAKEYMINNLLGGFLNRAEHTAKYTFGKMLVVGDEPDLQIQGVWLMRGLELPDGLTKEHSQFEYYIPTKLDPRNNKDHDKLVREYLGAVANEKYKVEGLTVRTMKWQK